MANIQVTKGKASSVAILDGITFNRIPLAGTNQDLFVIKTDNPWKVSGTATEISPTINSVDIDWNDAKLELPESLGGTQYITSSGQLLSIIKNMADLISPEEPEPEPQPTYYTCTCYVANGSGIVDGGTNTKTVSVVKNSQPQFTITPNTGYTTDGATVQNGTINGYIVTSDPVDNNGFMVTVECMLAYTYSYVEPTRTLQSIMWSGGSVSPTTINEGSTGTFNKGTVTAVFDNGDLVNVTSSATFTQYINNVSKGTISGTSVTAPSVSADSTVTIKASYGGKTATEKVTYTSKDTAVTERYYLGETDQETFTVNDFNMTGTKPTTININRSTGDTVTVWIYPQSWGKPSQILDPNGNDMTNTFIYGDTWMTIPNGYYGGWYQSSNNTTWTITW